RLFFFIAVAVIFFRELLFVSPQEPAEEKPTFIVVIILVLFLFFFCLGGRTPVPLSGAIICNSVWEVGEEVWGIDLGRGHAQEQQERGHHVVRLPNEKGGDLPSQKGDRKGTSPPFWTDPIELNFRQKRAYFLSKIGIFGKVRVIEQVSLSSPNFHFITITI